MNVSDISSKASWPPLPAQHRYSPFFDFLGDALFQHRHAAAALDRHSVNRFARAAVIASALSVECLANCLLAYLELHPEKFQLADREKPLDKIARFFEEEGIPGFGKGTRTSQRCDELIRIRNAYVHPKIRQDSAVLDSVKDGGDEWIIPMSVDLTLWPRLGIPRGTFAWDAKTSAVVLEAALSFHHYVLSRIQENGGYDLAVLLASRMDVSERLRIAIPLDDDLKRELRAAKDYGLLLDDLGLTAWFG